MIDDGIDQIDFTRPFEVLSRLPGATVRAYTGTAFYPDAGAFAGAREHRDRVGERAVITVDVMHHPFQLARPEWSSDLDVDKALSIGVRARDLAK